MTHPAFPPLQPVEVPASDTAMLERIGRLRYDIWTSEGPFDKTQAPNGIWLDEWDPVGRHWVVCDAEGGLLASARLCVHDSLERSRDGHHWIAHGRELNGRVAELARLVACQKARGLGLGLALNQVRIAAAKAAGADWVIVTATPPNVVLLTRLGFENVGMEHPRTPDGGGGLVALQLKL